MGELSPIHWLIVLAVILLLFGGRKIPELAKGLGEGIRNFKEGMSGAAHTHTPPPPPPVQAAPPVAPPAEEKKV
jgi:sec-independent protein translocase protein TatA